MQVRQLLCCPLFYEKATDTSARHAKSLCPVETRHPQEWITCLTGSRRFSASLASRLAASPRNDTQRALDRFLSSLMQLLKVPGSLAATTLTHGSRDLALRLTLGNRRALVVLPAAPSQGNLDLGPTVFKV